MKTNKLNKPDYGQDMPVIVFVTAIIFAVFSALSIWQFIEYSENQSNGRLIIASVAGIVAIFSILLTITVLWASRVGKFLLRDKTFLKLNFKGNESVLDLGCGRGLFLMEAAKRIPKGRAVGADIWDQNVEYKNTSAMVLENARLEGVSDIVEVVTADAQAMQFADNSFDVVMTSLMMHHVPDKSKALKEMFRVLKPGGTLVIADVMSKQYASELKSLGLRNVKAHYVARLIFIPAYITIGTK